MAGEDEADLPFLTEIVDLDAEADAWKKVESIELDIGRLLCSVRQYLALLADINSHHIAYNRIYGPKSDLKSSIDRYTNLWLPLYGNQPEDIRSNMVPPLDVAWIWCCHRLSPLSYHHDMLSLHGKLLDASIQDPLSFNNKAEGVETTRKLWDEAYPTHLYDDLAGSSVTAQDRNPGGTNIELTCDLYSAVQSQQNFLDQSDRSWTKCNEYIMGSVTRYRLFLSLLASNPGVFLAPTFDIDVIWHSHMMTAKAYIEETAAIFGCVLEHSVGGSSEKMLNAAKATSRAWNVAYGVPYMRAGAMHMKPPPELSAADIPEASDLKSANFGGYKGLTPRLVFRAVVTVWGLTPCPSPPKQPVFVQLRALSGSPTLTLSTPEKQFSHPKHPPQWNHSWSFLCEKGSEGVSLQLVAQPPLWLKEIWGERVLGTASLQWARVQDQPALFLDTELVLSGFSFFLMDSLNSRAVPRLHVSVSLTPPALGPYLLRTVFMQATDDSGAMVCDRNFIQQGLKPQTGRWVSRTVYDHANREVFVIRKRVASGVRYNEQRPTHVMPMERVIVVHQGGWTYLEEDGYGSNYTLDPPHCRVGTVTGEIIAQAVPLPSHDLSAYQKFRLVGGGDQLATFTVMCDSQAEDWLDTLQLSLEDDNGCPARLLMGRHMGYRVEGASASEEQNFVTLIRFTSRYPRGRATALFNWRCSTMEAVSEEQPVLVLLLLVTFCEALREMRGVNRMKAFRSVNLPMLETLSQWDAIVPCKCSGVGGAAVSEKKGESGRHDEADNVCSEDDMGHWWNKDKCVKHLGAGNCGAGACGTNVQPVFS